jgi:anthranilate synthase component 1
MQLYPDRKEFCRLAAQYRVIPISIDFSADLETPVSIYYKLVGDRPGFILESAETSKTFGRYSFIGTQPFTTIKLRKTYSEVSNGAESHSVDGAPLSVLKNILKQYTCPEMNLPPFSGGAVGYFSYEAVSTWERVRGVTLTDDTVIGELMLCQVLVAMDHLTHSAKLIYLTQVNSQGEADIAYEAAAAEITKVIDSLKQPVSIPRVEKADTTSRATLAEGDNRAKQQYMDNIITAKEYIAAGDIFQVVLSQVFKRKIKEKPFILYRRLRQVNPSPYMFYINYGHRQLVGASPEMLVKLQDRQVFTCPIAGTRPRGKTGEEDARLAAELLADPKELAEHSMLVDLGRNDIGRISLPGTVEVKRLMHIENFSHVMHIVSEVTGKLAPQYTAADALSACFPAGTLSGAPKIRAMEIINELEGDQRGPYAGAVGYFDFRGNMDTCITIRTMVIDGDEVTIRTGAGIVADSVPEKEYNEICQKARALFEILGEG